jgi:hypothetical protein
LVEHCIFDVFFTVAVHCIVVWCVAILCRAEVLRKEDT